jgi:hypothetical protein
MAIIEKETNEHNTNCLMKLADMFFYDSETVSRIRNRIENPPKEYNEVKTLLGLDDYGRRWVKGTPTRKQNRAYSALLDVLRSKYNSTSESEIEDKLAGIYNILCTSEGYANYLKGKIEMEGQKQKLFKMLRKQKLLTESEIENLTSKKQGDSYHLCLSNNPLDFLVASSNQSFSSCLKLNGEYPHYAMGLLAQCLDPNRLIIFATHGKLRRYDMKGVEVKHFRYTSRSFCILDENDFLHVVKAYPNDNWEFESLLKHDMDLKAVRCYRTNEYTGKKSKYKFYQGYYADNNRAGIYIDAYSLRDNRWDFSVNAACSAYCPEWRTDRGWCDIDDLDDIGYEYRCERCDCGLHSDELNWDPEGDYAYCDECFYENHFRCDSCGDIGYNDDACQVDCNILCQDCFDLDWFYCDRCGEATLHENGCDCDGEMFCIECADQKGYTYCESCDAYVNDGVLIEGQEYFCQDCAVNNGYQECEYCGEWHSELINCNGDMLCKDCA